MMQYQFALCRLPGWLLVLATLCLSGAVSHSTHAEEIDYPFGRLFTAASERQDLDAIKRGLKPAASTVSDKVVVPLEPALDENVSSVRFSGYIRRADGSVVLWVDGATDLSGRSDEQYKQQFVGRNNEALFTTSNNSLIDSAEQQVRLRVGQTWIISEDSVVEVYRGSSLSDSMVKNLDHVPVDGAKTLLDKSELPTAEAMRENAAFFQKLPFSSEAQ